MKLCGPRFDCLVQKALGAAATGPYWPKGARNKKVQKALGA